MNPTVGGARGQIRSARDLVDRSRAWAGNSDCEVQLFDASLVLGEEHLLAAAALAHRAASAGTMVAATEALETLLYASGERQIAHALSKMGLNDDTATFAAIVWGGSPDELFRALGLEPDPAVLSPNSTKLRRFGLTQTEIDTVPEGRAADLVFERMAAVELRKR